MKKKIVNKRERERKNVFPNLKVSSKSQNYRKNIYISDLMNFEEREKLDGWQLNSPTFDN